MNRADVFSYFNVSVRVCDHIEKQLNDDVDDDDDDAPPVTQSIVAVFDAVTINNFLKCGLYAIRNEIKSIIK